MTIDAARGSSFLEIDLSSLEAMSSHDIDGLAYGVVGLSEAGIVEVYGAAEARLAGLDAKTVVGTHYFSVTAQCMNNFMVAQRFSDEADLDVVIDYVLTLRMRPTPVRLRLLKSSSIARHYILIER